MLGGNTPRRFIARYWQKQPLFIPSALPQFRGLLTPADLAALAARDDVQSRVVVRRGRRWEAHQGPFAKTFFRSLPARGWSLLVNDVNHHLTAARALLDRFAFLPHARLDDLMVSYAPTGGGVGAHYDSYDVFLLQGAGRRRWRVSHQGDLTLVDGAPLKVLRNFRHEEEWISNPGDMLYLPPGRAHEGVALDDHCMTYSIGFRAPAWADLAVHFLRYLEDRVALPGLYEDPHLSLQKSPARIGDAMVDSVAQQLAEIRWQRADVGRFLGEYLSEPKAHVSFEPPPAPLSLPKFTTRIRRGGVTLDLKSQMQFLGTSFFLNGERVEVKGRAHVSLQRLANTRSLRRIDTSQRGLVALLHEWYGAGYLHVVAAGEGE